MTARHLVDGLMRAMRCNTHSKCEIKLGLGGGTFSHWSNDKGRGVSIDLLVRVQERSNVSLLRLIEWYRLPEGAALEFYAESVEAEVVRLEADARTNAAAKLAAAERRLRKILQAITALEEAMKA